MKLSIATVLLALMAAPAAAQVPDVCVDIDTTFDESPFRDCSWVETKPGKRCEKVDDNGSPAEVVCASTCFETKALTCNDCCTGTRSLCDAGIVTPSTTCDGDEAICIAFCGGEGTLSPTSSTSAPVVSTPAPTSAPVVSTPAPTSAPVVSTSAPVVSTPVPTSAPVVSTSAPFTSKTSAPVVSTPAPTKTPTQDPTASPATCTNVPAWKDDADYECSWYEENEPLGCPLWRWYSGADGLTAGEACCHCAAEICTEIDFVDDAGYDCSWYEENEQPGCPIWWWYPGGDYTAGSGCCHCSLASEGCSRDNEDCCIDYPNWVDKAGFDCSWYTENEEEGCPNWNWYPDDQGVPAAEACCKCRVEF